MVPLRFEVEQQLRGPGAGEGECDVEASGSLSLRYVAPHTSRFVAWVTSRGGSPQTLSWRQACDDEPVECASHTGPTEPMVLALEAGEAVYLGVEGPAAHPVDLHIREVRDSEVSCDNGIDDDLDGVADCDDPQCSEFSTCQALACNTRPISSSTHLTGWLSGSDGSIAPSCGVESGSERTYEFTAPTTSTYVFDLAGSSLPTTMAVYDGCGGVELACATRSTGPDQDQGRIQMDLDIGDTVMVVVDAASASGRGRFQLTVDQLRATEQDCALHTDADGDGLFGCLDPDCFLDAACVEICDDGIDNDEDGLLDCADPRCGGHAACGEQCGSGRDEDADGLTDCLDSDCRYAAECAEDCGNGLDDDGDGLADCLDAACQESTWCQEDCTNGVDDDGDHLLDCLDPSCGAHAACVEVCDNGVDDNGDCRPDCADASCAGDAACQSSTCGTERPIVYAPSQRVGTLDGRGDDVVLSCSEEGSADYQVAFFAPEDATYVFDTVGSSTDMVVALLEDCGDRERACGVTRTGADRSQGQVVAELSRGERVMVAVDTRFKPETLQGSCIEDPSFVLNVAELQPSEVHCEAGRDLDADGLTGCEDPDCASHPACMADAVWAAQSADPFCHENACARRGLASSGKGEERQEATRPAPIPMVPMAMTSGSSLTWTSTSAEPAEPDVTADPATSQIDEQTFGSAGEPQDPVWGNRGLNFGSFPDTVTFDLAPAPNGSAPELSISHTKGSDVGVGRGFALSTPGPIWRQSEHGGPPSQTEVDRYVIDGLVLVDMGAGTYEPWRRDGRVAKYDAATNTWAVLDQNGTLTTYGSISGSTGDHGTVQLYAADGRAHDDGGASTHTDEASIHTVYELCDRDSNELCNTSAWYPTQQVDSFGNTTKLHYRISAAMTGAPTNAEYWFGDSRNRLLDRIEYNFIGSSARDVVSLTWGSHPHPTFALKGGVPTFLTERLTRVEVTSGGSFYSRYTLSYEGHGGQSFLSEIRRTSDDAGGTPQIDRLVRKYHYNLDDDILTDEDGVALPFFGQGSDLTSLLTLAHVDDFDNMTDTAALHAVNANGDGRTDLSVTVNGTRTVLVYDATAATPTFDNDASTVHLFDESGLWTDLNGDGFPELLFEETGETFVQIKSYDPYTRTTQVAELSSLNADVLEDSRLVDVNGDGFDDLINTETEEWIRNSGVEPWFDAAPI
nr:hypothetical protein [Myxococcales bacterium]